MSVRYRLDFDQPVVECCGILYELGEQYQHCQDCGEAFDWNDILEAWNIGDWAHLMEPDEFRALGIDLEFHGVVEGEWFGFGDEDDEEGGLGMDDDEIPPWAFQDRQTDLFKRALDLDDNYENLFDAPLRTVPGPAKPPTAHLREHHRPQQNRPDPFLDVAIPDEVL